MEKPTFHRDDLALEVAIMELLSRRGPGKTICPSEAARLVDPSGWKELMDKARAAVQRLVAQGEIVVTQRGKIVDPSQVNGPIRLKIR
jgi:DNA-binding transcriptional regulator PaaX